MRIIGLEEMEGFEEMSEVEQKAARKILDDNITDDPEEAIEKAAESNYYHDCLTMKDVAMEIMHETGQIDEIPEPFNLYFDYEAYGRDLEIEGTFIYLGNAVYVEVIN